MDSELLTFKNKALASRTSASRFREQLSCLLGLGSTVQIDLQGVETISDSFADELFGVLTQEFGANFLLDHIRVVGGSDAALYSVATAIDRRATGELVAA